MMRALLTTMWAVVWLMAIATLIGPGAADGVKIAATAVSVFLGALTGEALAELSLLIVMGIVCAILWGINAAFDLVRWAHAKAA